MSLPILTVYMCHLLMMFFSFNVIHFNLQLDIDLKDMYMMQVLQAKAFMAIDAHHMKFLIQNFDESSKQLMVRFHSVSYLNLNEIISSKKLILCYADD